ncbi:SDR family oxidoreductase [Pseudofulvimonas gallinarii]|uniref:Short-subunit dehydrogenase n=1 Tax=Pseudofulvimonas gallinarii TaxID=634155 RepID=A0A4R3LDI1_9GAMM|nr:SDR family oxidoreductase [Pseudofulvimonas gallinarii]TCS98221.1 short-subunit dehydrogenase [Pseudofulvimonas gallinarii]THD13803.1 short-chain dehydrogenase [Pseudofulvimonas gallinarii]
MKKILVIGATSAIAESCARLWAQRGDALYLLGRDKARLRAIADDLRARGAAEVAMATLDVRDRPSHVSAIEQARTAMAGVDIALLAHGTLPDPGECDRDLATAMDAFDTNGTGTIALMHRLAALLELQGSGHLAVIGSVAGDRGRASNAIYGAAKAAVETYASALRQRLGRRGIQVLTIKPGFVDTPMTARFRKSALWASPSRVAASIVRAIDRDRAVIYVPWFWRPVMAIIRALPEFVFRRMKF